MKTLLTVFIALIASLSISSCTEEDPTAKFSSGGSQGLQAEQSGVWRGYYLQDGLQEAMALDILIADNRISGQGSDVVGSFNLSGGYDDQGNVLINKAYVGAHTVTYRGIYQNTQITGTWTIADEINPSNTLTDQFALSFL